jgi:prepilin-type processing-associated H-X9-DG protein/prepilin-type N-terminal cleavage/methylation domain-containing protein
MRRRLAFTLIELLVVVAIIVTVMAMLLPAIQRVRATADRMICADHLKQNLIAVHNYHVHHDALPTANTLDWPVQKAWFAEIDYQSNQADARRGQISPFLEGNKKVLHCPSFEVDRVEPLYGGETGGFGYNLNLGAADYSRWPEPPRMRIRRIADFPATSRTLVLTDSARIQLPWSGDPVVRATENYYLTGPDDAFAEPGTHFRHYGSANAAYLDGHVENVVNAGVPFPSQWPAAALELARKLNLGYVSPTSIDAYRPR